GRGRLRADRAVAERAVARPRFAKQPRPADRPGNVDPGGRRRARSHRGRRADQRLWPAIAIARRRAGRTRDVVAGDAVLLASAPRAPPGGKRGLALRSPANPQPRLANVCRGQADRRACARYDWFSCTSRKRRLWTRAASRRRAML